MSSITITGVQTVEIPAATLEPDKIAALAAAAAAAASETAAAGSATAAAGSATASASSASDSAIARDAALAAQAAAEAAQTAAETAQTASESARDAAAASATAAANSATASAGSAASAAASALLAQATGVSLVNDYLASKAPRGGIISTGATYVATTADNTGLAFGTGNLTIGFWFRRTSVFASQRVLLKKHDGTNGLWVEIVPTGGKLRLHLNATDYDFASVPFVDNAWTFVTLRINRAGNASLDLNGVNFGSISISAIAAATLTSTTALYWFSSGSTHCDGTLGECWIVNGLLTATDVANIYKAGSIAPFSASFTFFQWLAAAQGYGPILRDLSGNNQHGLLGTTGISHAVSLNPRGTPSRAPRTALSGDGTANSYARAALGSQDPSTGDFSLWFDLLPASSGSGEACLTGSTVAVGSAGSLRISRTTDVVVTFYAAAGNRTLTVSGLGTALGTRRSVLIFTRTGSTPKLYLGVDGDLFDITALTVSATASTPPAWSDAVTGTYLNGYWINTASAGSGVIYDLRLANVAMTEAQLRTEYERGEPGPEWVGASKTAKYTSDFSAGTDGWSSIRATQTGNQDAVSDGSISKDDCLILATTATVATHLGYRSGVISGARRYRLTFDYYIPNANTEIQSFHVAPTDSSNTDPGAVTGGVFTTRGAWTSASVLISPTSATQDRIPFWLRNASGQASFTATTTEGIYLKGVTVEQIGITTRLRTDQAAGLTALNGAKSSTNDSSDFLLSTTGVTHSPTGGTRRQLIRPGTLTFTTSPSVLNLQAFGASVVDTGKKWRIVSFSGTASGAANISLGNASGGAQYVSAKAVTAADFDTSDAQFVTRRISGANLWVKSDATVTLTDVLIVLEQID